MFWYRATVETQVIMQRDAAIMETERARELAEQARLAAEQAAAAEKAAREATPTQENSEKNETAKPESEINGDKP